MKLRFAEEITLLMLNDEDGEFVRVPGLVDAVRIRRRGADGAGAGEPD